MKITSFDNILFQKKLVATGAIKSQCNGNQDIDIYHLNRYKDILEIENAFDIPFWQPEEELNFVSDIIDWSEGDHKEYNLYTCENRNGELLGYISTERTRGKNAKLHLIETAPALKSNKENGASYIGETMMAFVAALAKKSLKKNIKIDCIADSAEGFYRHCKTEILERYPDMGFSKGQIRSDDFDLLIDQNEKHTGKRIELIG